MLPACSEAVSVCVVNSSVLRSGKLAAEASARLELPHRANVRHRQQALLLATHPQKQTAKGKSC